MRIRLTASFATFFLVAVFAGSAQAEIAAKNKPNVLLIYTDDHRASGVGAFGGDQVRTPNIDELASQGVVLRRTYLMGSFLGATWLW